jgi:alkanesulfonate monooxygenase SsuD/methylene tetrahydromethanopterin reductase-like flavin-dependent oxidoreductase (luciferase family)
MLGVSGPLGVRHAAEWADGWMPTDFGTGDIAELMTSFRQQVIGNRRDPDSVPITVLAMYTPDSDGLKRYQDMGVERVLVGIDMELWGQHDKIKTLMDRVAENIPQVS